MRSNGTVSSRTYRRKATTDNRHNLRYAKILLARPWPLLLKISPFDFGRSEYLGYNFLSIGHAEAHTQLTQPQTLAVIDRAPCHNLCGGGEANDRPNAKTSSSRMNTRTYIPEIGHWESRASHG